MKIGKILIAGGITAVLLGLAAKNKYDRIARVFSTMTIKPYGFPRNVRLVGLRELSFVTDVILENPSSEDFSVSGYIAVLKQISVKYRGQVIGLANVDFEEISIPARNTLVLHDIRVELATGAILDNIFELYQLLSQGDGDWGEVTFGGVIDAPGGPYEIG